MVRAPLLVACSGTGPVKFALCIHRGTRIKHKDPCGVFVFTRQASQRVGLPRDEPYSARFTQLRDKDSLETLGFPTASTPAFLHGKLPFPDPLPIQVRNFVAALLAAGLGFEPRYTAPEAVVLPLDDPAMLLLGH